jgi:hypothetical protein
MTEPLAYVIAALAVVLLAVLAMESTEPAPEPVDTSRGLAAE